MKAPTITRATPFAAPARAADAKPADAAAPSAFRAMLHDAKAGDASAKPDDAPPPAADQPTAEDKAASDDAQVIAAQQAAIALAGMPAALPPPTAMAPSDPTPDLRIDGKPDPTIGLEPDLKPDGTPDLRPDGKIDPDSDGKPDPTIAPRTTAIAGDPAATAQTAAAQWLLGVQAAPTGKPAAAAPAGAQPIAAAGAVTAGRLAHAAGKPDGKPDARAAHAADAAAALAAAATNSTDSTDDAPAPLTPLEQAVHDLIGQLSDERGASRGRGKLAGFEIDRDADDRDPATRTPAIDASWAAPAIATPTAITAPSRAASVDPTRPTTLAQPAELPSNPSHVHLVLDDGPERVVMTVAVRGTDIHVALRSNDDATTNALARNAASLDHAMRARGLALGELTTEREPPREQPRRQAPDDEPPPRHSPDAEPFQLEEIR
ncbi:MAG TPA: hypothetical protein VFP84_04890 [Kofleriaceae bacterium]|nr:hypothetical protein [Kofleriaceae bacterium]